MGYVLRAFLGPTPAIESLAGHYQHATSVALGWGLSLLPMTAALYDEINHLVESAGISPFVLLTQHVEEQLLPLIGSASFCYVEAEYFGGSGYQAALLWQEGRRSLGPTTINAVLSNLGVKAGWGRDAFDTLGLGRHRETEEWLLS